MKKIYLDHAAATPVDDAVLAAMLPYYRDKFYNPSAVYLAAKAVREDIKTARSYVAKILGCKSTEVIFTAGGTEANNLAVHGIMQQYPDANIITSSIEHDSVLQPASQYHMKTAEVDASGTLVVDDLRAKIDDKTVLVSVMYANNELGTVQPLNQVGTLINDVRKDRSSRGNKLPLFLHTDACQAPNYLRIHTNQLKFIDLMTLNGGKIYGPKQSGVLYARRGLNLKPQITGGGQESGLRSGTENVPSIVGFAKALEIADGMRTHETDRIHALKIALIKGLSDELPDVTVNGGGVSIPNIVHVTFKGLDNERLMMQLDEAGIMCAVGSACSASNEDPSHVLQAIGMSESDARSSLRFSMGRATTEEDVYKTILALKELLTVTG